MTILLAFSVTIRVLAMAWSVVLLRRLRDWRMGVLTAMLALMAASEAVVLNHHLELWGWNLSADHPEAVIPGGLISLMALLSVVALDRLLITMRRDREKRVVAEDSAREDAARQGVLLEQLPAIAWTVDRDLRFTSSLGAGLAGLGLKPNEVVGQTLWQFFDTEDDNYVGIAAAKLALEGERIAYDLDWLGQSYHILQEPLRDRAGEIVGVVGAGLDVTEHKQAEEALRASEERYRELFEESLDAVFISTPSGGMLEINSAGLELFGYESKEELMQVDIGRQLYVDPGERRRAQELLAENGYLKDFPVRLRTKDGAQKDVLESTTAVRDADGRVVAYRGLLRDVTAKRALENQLQQSQRMEAVGRLARGVAHEFNNLLTVINGRCDLMLARLAPDDAVVQDVEETKSAAQRAGELTGKLLTLSRHRMVSPQTLDLNDAVRGIQDVLERSLGEDVALETKLDPDLAKVRADAGQMEQVLLNLALNGRDAMPRGGRLVLETANHEVLAGSSLAQMGWQEGSYVRLRVTDTGEGIDPGIREHIFEPFFTTRNPAERSGLGLSTVYGIVEQCSGHMRVESDLGSGACFELYLPSFSVAARKPAVAKAKEVSSGETVLVVEDEETLRRLLCKFLGSQGYEVLEAGDGETALAIASGRQDIDLLLTDLVLPDIDGGEIAMHLKKAIPDLKVLFMSGYSRDREFATGSRKLLDESNFIQKPFSTELLARRLRTELDAG